MKGLYTGILDALSTDIGETLETGDKKPIINIRSGA